MIVRAAIILWAILVVPGCVMPGPAGSLTPDDVDTSESIAIPHVIGSAPLIDGLIEPEAWNGALVFEEDFVIDDGSAVAGTFPTTVKLLGNEYGLYIGVEMRNVSKNPYPVDGGGEHGFFPDHLSFLLAGPTGPLVPPEDMWAVANLWEWGSSSDDGYWSGTEWVFDHEMAPGGYKDGRPTSGRWSPANEHEGILTWEVFIARESSRKEADGFQISGPGTFRMALWFYRQNDENDPNAVEHAHSDTFPGVGHTRTEKDPETWLKLRFDY